mmetsp:Transcript_23933/g.20969  ORF Transcript_23933/g.20969 Transcript_23933/m.20969 type:complete len:95 (+) Transcript_23933:19-303(+)
MAEELQAVFTLDHIFKGCAERHPPGDSHMSVLVNPGSYADAYNAFYKWVKGQIDLGRTVNVPNFGNLTMRSIEDRESFLHINLHENYLQHHGIA